MATSDGSPAKRTRRSKSNNAGTTFKLPNITGPTITVLIETNSTPKETLETFHIHVNVLPKHSKLLQHVEDPPASSNTHTLDLDQIEPATFKIYVQYLYTQKIEQPAEDRGIGLRLMKAYVLAEMFADLDFQNAVLDDLIAYYSKNARLPSVLVINAAYNGTMKDSPIRRLMVDFWVWAGSATEHDVRQFVNRAHNDFVNDVLMALLNERPRPQGVRPWVHDPGVYGRRDNGAVQVDGGTVRDV